MKNSKLQGMKFLLCKGNSNKGSGHVCLNTLLCSVCYFYFLFLCTQASVYVCAGQRVVFRRHVFLHWEPDTEESQGNMLAWQQAPSLAKSSLGLFLRQCLSFARAHLFSQAG